MLQTQRFADSSNGKCPNLVAACLAARDPEPIVSDDLPILPEVRNTGKVFALQAFRVEALARPPDVVGSAPSLPARDIYRLWKLGETSSTWLSGQA